MKFQYCVETFLDPLPVSKVIFPPLWRAGKGVELTHIWESTSGLAYHLQSVRIQLPRHLQPKEFLHFLDFFDNRIIVFPSIDLFFVFSKVVVVF